MEFKTTIDTADFDGIVPVYCLYGGQYQPQPAFVRMTKDGVIDCDYKAEANATTSDVWHEVTLVWDVPSDVKGSALLERVQELQPLFERVHAGHEIEFSGHNWIGTLTDDAKQARESIEDSLSDLNDCTLSVCTMSDWLASMDFSRAWPASYDLETAINAAEIEATDALIDAQVYVKEGDTRADLLGACEEIALRHPEQLHQVHVDALVKEGNFTREAMQEIIEDNELDLVVPAA